MIIISLSDATPLLLQHMRPPTKEQEEGSPLSFVFVSASRMEVFLPPTISKMYDSLRRNTRRMYLMH